MAATRRELLIGLGAGLVSLQETRGETIEAARRRWATVGDIERLEREIRDQGQRLQNALARVRRTGFGPSTLAYEDTITLDGEYFTDAYAVPFPGSVVALSVGKASALTGTPGVDYWTFQVVNSTTGALTDATVVLDGGDSTGVAVFDKGETTFAPADLLSVRALKTASPGSLNPVQVIVWVSFT